MTESIDALAARVLADAKRGYPCLPAEVLRLCRAILGQTNSPEPGNDVRSPAENKNPCDTCTGAVTTTYCAVCIHGPNGNKGWALGDHYHPRSVNEYVCKCGWRAWLPNRPAYCPECSGTDSISNVGIASGPIGG